MMSPVSVFLIFSLIGILGARQPDIDINRIRLVSKERHPLHNPFNRRSVVESNRIDRYYRNDYDDRSGRVAQLRSPAAHIRRATTPPAQAEAVKIHQPREDPRLFYQSDSYLQEINRKNINSEVSSIYPGRDVVRSNELKQTPSPVRLRYRIVNSIDEENICIKCPHDRTLIAKAGANKVSLQYPRLFSCSGHKAPRDVHFVQMYGANFNSLLGEGSHMLIGRIEYKNKTLQTCKMQIHVLMQTCPVPKYLVAHCDVKNKTCNFRCRDPKLEIHGKTTVMCGNHMQWNENLPICRAHTWCTSPPPPEYGRVSCKGPTVESGLGLKEGSNCRVRCALGWRAHSRIAAVCRRGTWTQKLACHPKRSTK